MLYQAAVILTYPVMLERALTPCALRGLARRRPCWSRRYQAWGGTGTRRHTDEEVTLLKPRQPLNLTHLFLGGT